MCVRLRCYKTSQIDKKRYLYKNVKNYYLTLLKVECKFVIRGLLNNYKHSTGVCKSRRLKINISNV